MEGCINKGMSIQTSLSRILKEVQVEDCLNDVGRLFCLYTCRFIKRRPLRSGLKKLVGVEPSKLLLNFKDELDHSIYKNRLFKAIHAMCLRPKKTEIRYAQEAFSNRVQRSDLEWFVSLLTKEEVASLAREWKDVPIYSNHGVWTIVGKLQGHIKNLARNNLSYISRYDDSQDQIDFIHDLNLHAVYIVRMYEVYGLSTEHLLRTVNQSLQHYAANVSSAYGRPKRRPVERTKQRNPFKSAWWIDPKTLAIKKVRFDGKTCARKLTRKKSIKILVSYKRKKEEVNQYVDVRHLYETKVQAVEFRVKVEKKLVSVMSRELPLIDFNSAELDQFRRTHSSLFQTKGEDGLRLIDVLPNKDINPTNYQQFYYNLSKQASERLAKFAELVTSDVPDGLFVQWLRKQNKEYAQLNPDQLGKFACRYMGISMDDIKQDLLRSPSHLWTRVERDQITQVESQNPPFSIL